MRMTVAELARQLQSYAEIDPDQIVEIQLVGGIIAYGADLTVYTSTRDDQPVLVIQADAIRQS